jgi:hypothetical protein
MTLRGVLAGLAGIAAWLAVMPLDKWLSGSRYDDVALLGMAATRRRAWLPLGLALHVLNGIAFGLVYAHVAERRLPGPGWVRGLLAAEAENGAVAFLTPLVDRYHPAVQDGRTGKTATAVALLQATWRHGVFGAVLGAVYAWQKAL